uniref:Uncharacterized LOC114461713 n=2 Tax=Gouania willdenowi TaxID=441366 RepID=A0A8C5EZB3_GOUWI
MIQGNRILPSIDQKARPLILSLMGAFVLQATATDGSHEALVSVWPQGPNIFLGESVFLQCAVKHNSSAAWSYQWRRYKPHTAPIPNPRHLVSGDSYSITAVTREDAGSYWCTAARKDRKGSAVVLNSLPAVLFVSAQTPPSPSLTPSTRLILSGQRFTVQCPASQNNSTDLKLRYFSPERQQQTTVNQTVLCSAQGRAAGLNQSDMCVFTAAIETSGLYWCEGIEGRSRALNITVSYGNIILMTPAFPVFEGDTVVLYCQYSSSNPNQTLFFKNRVEIITSTCPSSDRTAVMMTIENVTRHDEGLYKCASQDRTMESPESWLSVRPSADGTTGNSSGSWKWVIAPCLIIALLLILVTVWLVRHYRHQILCIQSCWPLSKEEVPAMALPVTTQDVTEVQWDLSWVEMSNLLDKQQLYPG